LTSSATARAVYNGARGEASTPHPNLASEAVGRRTMIELTAMGAETEEALVVLLKSESIATDGDSLESATPYRPER
jgi:hypothetical protein